MSGLSPARRRSGSVPSLSRLELLRCSLVLGRFGPQDVQPDGPTLTPCRVDTGTAHWRLDAGLRHLPELWLPVPGARDRASGPCLALLSSVSPERYTNTGGVFGVVTHTPATRDPPSLSFPVRRGPTFDRADRTFACGSRIPSSVGVRVLVWSARHDTDRHRSGPRIPLGLGGGGDPPDWEVGDGTMGLFGTLDQ